MVKLQSLTEVRVRGLPCEANSNDCGSARPALCRERVAQPEAENGPARPGTTFQWGDVRAASQYQYMFLLDSMLIRRHIHLRMHHAAEGPDTLGKSDH
jgi:hypothetical protein